MHPNRRCSRMTAHTPPHILLASHDDDLLAAVEPILLAAGHCVEVVLSAQAALASIPAHSPALALLDTNLSDLPIGQFLAAVRAPAEGGRRPIVRIASPARRGG